ncbi:MAG: alpha/beta hydrolase [Gammaproteobacteria bacterium]
MFLTYSTFGFLAWLSVTGLLYFLQDYLLFYPQPLRESEARFITQGYPSAEELTLWTEDGFLLHGWFLKTEGEGRAPALIYFGGNAEEVSWMLSEARRFPGWSLVLVNYRGYGLSQGKPSERALLSDGLLIYDSIAKSPEVDPNRIVVFGRSLGSGLAVYLAKQRKVTAVALVSPFDSVTSLARRSLPFVPVGLLLKHPFDSLSLAPSIETPMLTVVAGADTIIPPKHSRRLFEAWAGPKTFRVVEGADHNDIQAWEDYWQGIARFLLETVRESVGGRERLPGVGRL